MQVTNNKSVWKKEFSVFSHQELAYFDSAATSLVPTFVADEISQYIQFEHANSHRGFYQLSVNSTQIVEQTRALVAEFIHASSADDIIFTHNTTHAINLIADGYVKPYLEARHNIVVSVAEHHANFLPWQQLCYQTGAQFRVAPVLDTGEVDVAALEKLIDANTFLVSIAHISNVTGKENPISRIAQLAQVNESKLLVDGAQAIAHEQVDVQALGCDFYVFSGHKCYAGSGVGVLYVPKQLHQFMRPTILGGGIVDKVTTDSFTLSKGPQQFEAGSRNVAALVGLNAALKFIQQQDKIKIKEHISSLSDYLNFQLKELTFVNPISTLVNSSIVSLNLEQIHSHDVATCLDMDNIAVRAGHHCAQPLHQHFNVKSSVRISLGMYNDFYDIDRLIQSLAKTYRLLRLDR